MLVLTLKLLRNCAVLSWRFSESGKRQKSFCVCFFCIVSLNHRHRHFANWTFAWWFFKCKMPNEDSRCLMYHLVFSHTNADDVHAFTFRVDVKYYTMFTTRTATTLNWLSLWQCSHFLVAAWCKVWFCGLFSLQHNEIKLIEANYRTITNIAHIGCIPK